MVRSQRLFIPALVATFVGGALAATALTGASATGGAAARTSPLNPSRAPATAGVSPQSAGCTVHLTAGATPAQNYDACINGHGNVNGFSWGDASLSGPIQYVDNEGYCITRDDDTASPAHYYDGGSLGEAGFNASTTLMASSKTYTVTRNTSDGVFKVVQNFFLKPATSQLFIGMQITNLDGVSHQVGVERFFHPKIAGNSTSVNWEDFKTEATSADKGGQGVQLALLSRNVWSGGGAIDASSGRIASSGFASTLAADFGCRAAGQGVAASPGDNYGGAVGYNGFGISPVIPPGGTQTFQFAYRIY